MNETFKKKEAERLGGMIASYADDLREGCSQLQAIDQKIADLEAEKQDLTEAVAYYETQKSALERQRDALLSDVPAAGTAEKKPRIRKLKAEEPVHEEIAPAAPEAAPEEDPAAVAAPEPKNDLPFPDPAGGPVPEEIEEPKDAAESEPDGGDLFGNMSL